MHKASFVVWLAVFGLHVLVYLPRLPRLVFAHGRPLARVGLIAGSLLAGGALAAGAYSLAGPWLHRDRGREEAEATVKCTPGEALEREPLGRPGDGVQLEPRAVPALELLAVDVERHPGDLADEHVLGSEEQLAFP